MDKIITVGMDEATMVEATITVTGPVTTTTMDPQAVDRVMATRDTTINTTTANSQLPVVTVVGRAGRGPARPRLSCAQPVQLGGASAVKVLVPTLKKVAAARATGWPSNWAALR